MSFSKNQNDPSGWKEKYYALLDSQEQAERLSKSHEELFSKTLIRLTLAVKGFNPALDPQLDHIRNALKSGLRRDEWMAELGLFSEALLILEDPAENSHSKAGLLFDFLCWQYPDCRDELLVVQQQYESRELINQQRLFMTLVKLLANESAVEIGIKSSQDLLDHEEIGQHLLQLLDSADLPECFDESALQLKRRLQKGQPLVPIFDDAVSLLMAVKKHIQQEQQALADFLSTLTEELAEIGLKASGVNIAAEDAMKQRDHLDRDVAAQMADLQRKSASATQLEPLKQLVSMRLAGISQQIQKHNTIEQEKKLELHRELLVLTKKIGDLESETSELKNRLDVAQRRASLDSLTGLPNRQAFEDCFQNEISRSDRHGHSLTLAIWDIDFFKAINDTYGHKSGDKALVIISKLMSTHCRKSDFIGRFGGEEFVMLFPETDINTALLVSNKLRDIIANSGFNANGHKVSITLSCGLAEYVPGDDCESLFVRADSALYKAKQQGRNQCVLAESP